MGGALAQQLTQCGLLRELQIDSTQMTDKGLVALGKVIQQGKHLRKVDLAGTECGKAGPVTPAASVEACASLETFASLQMADLPWMPRLRHFRTSERGLANRHAGCSWEAEEQNFRVSAIGDTQQELWRRLSAQGVLRWPRDR